MEGLLKQQSAEPPPWFLIQELWSGTQECALLTSSQTVLTVPSWDQSLKTLDYQRMETHRAGKMSLDLTTECQWQADMLDFTDPVLNSDLHKAIQLCW